MLAEYGVGPCGQGMLDPANRKGRGLIRYLFPTCEQELGGLAYDRKSNLLYLVQSGAGTTEESPFGPLPIIHVFRVVS